MANYETVFSDSVGRILRLEGTGEAFFADFYRRFVASSEEVAEKFKNTDMAKQRKMLKSSFFHMLSFSVSNDVPEFLAQIAETHRRSNYDIRPALYDLWLECLIATAKQHDSLFSDEVELAWHLVMARGIAYMKFKYAH
jgi:hemoglobin-like flavoprotein